MKFFYENVKIGLDIRLNRAGKPWYCFIFALRRVSPVKIHRYSYSDKRNA